MVISVVGSRFRSNQYPIPERMKAWVLGGPEELSLIEKPVPEPGPAEVLVRVDAIAVCATDIEIIRHGEPAMIDGGPPFNRGFTPGHEYMGTIVKLGPTVDEFQVGEGVVVIGPGPIGLMGVGVAKALGAQPVILTGTRDGRLEMGKKLGADAVVNVGREDPVEAVQHLTQGKGVQYVLECSGAPNALNEAARMVNRGGRICLAAFPAEPVPVDLAYLVRNNIYVFGIRGEGKSATHRAAALMAQRRFDAKLIHTHTFPLAEVPTAIRYAQERIEDAIKVVVQIR